jgi:hypothetical protein
VGRDSAMRKVTVEVAIIQFMFTTECRQSLVAGERVSVQSREGGSPAAFQDQGTAAAERPFDHPLGTPHSQPVRYGTGKVEAFALDSSPEV